MSSPWEPAGGSAPLDRGSGLVTTLEGSTFCLSGRTGDVTAEPHGLFILDTRMLSHLRLTLDGQTLQPLSVTHDVPYEATFVLRPWPKRGQADSDILVIRRRFVGQGMREDYEIRNHGPHAVTVELAVGADADFASLFAVKEGNPQATVGSEFRSTEGGMLQMAVTQHGLQRRVTLRPSPEATVVSRFFRWTVDLEPRERWHGCVTVSCAVDGTEITPRYVCGEPVEDAVPAERRNRWQLEATKIRTADENLQTLIGTSLEDLGALRIFDPDHRDLPVVAAGAPWYMTLFGRDSLLTAWSALPADPYLALGVLEALARRQGKRIDPETEEEPGKILHEVRTAWSVDKAGDAEDVYYGSVDATPLFVMLLAEAHRWGLPRDRIAALLPAADDALGWMLGPGDDNRDGFVDYARMTPRGLLNQGWKDSADGILTAGGDLPRAPIALCEVQGYSYAAYLGRAELAEAFDDPDGAREWRRRAEELRHRFDEAFWLPDVGYYAMGLDADGKPIDALASNMAHLLWTGIVPQQRAAAIAGRLLSPDLFSGWGVRTLGTSMTAYNPLSYHNGSVWPHDSAIALAGLARYGHLTEARTLAEGLIACAMPTEGRLPELFAGIDRQELAIPVSYPSSCSPQAWAAAAPLLMIRGLLRFDPDVPAGRFHLEPAVPSEWLPMRLEGVRLGEARVDIVVGTDGRATVNGLPEGMQRVGARLSTVE
jgi:glycogen debranching enzyme